MASRPAPVVVQHASSLSPIWGPFHGPGDALAHVGPFINQTIGSTVGIAWAGGGRIYPLRRPHYDGNGFGEVVIVEWRNVPPPPPPPAAPTTIGGRFMSFIEEVFDRQVEADQLDAQAYAAAGHMISGAFSTLWNRAMVEHRSDTEGVALDVLAIALSIGFFAGPFGALALIGGVALLAMDGRIWGKEMMGDETGAEEARESTKLYRWAAAIMCLPDALWGLGKMVPELPKLANSLHELKAARASEEATAWRMQSNSGRYGRAAIDAESRSAAQAAKADFARRFAAVAEQARRRAAAKGVELGRTWAELLRTLIHEISPRLMLGETLRLMTGDLTLEDKEAVLRIVRNYCFHIVSVHR